MSQRIPAWKRLGLQLKNVSEIVESKPQGAVANADIPRAPIDYRQSGSDSIITGPEATVRSIQFSEQPSSTTKSKKRLRDTNGEARPEKSKKKRRRHEEQDAQNETPAITGNAQPQADADVNVKLSDAKTHGDASSM